MISFFRRIRKELSYNSQFLKYSRYALGEIFLVVVGILIALQINNWNEERKTKIEEEKILLLIRKNLELDLRNLEGNNLQVLKQSIESSFVIENQLSKCTSYNDSLSSHFSKIPRFFIHMPNTSAYDNLKATGFNQIRNDSLREKFQRLYQFHYRLANYQNDIGVAKFQNRIVDFYLENFYDFVLGKSAIPRDYKTLCLDDNFKELLKYSRREKQEQFHKRRRLAQETRAIISMVNMELDTKYP